MTLAEKQLQAQPRGTLAATDPSASNAATAGRSLAQELNDHKLTTLTADLNRRLGGLESDSKAVTAALAQLAEAAGARDTTAAGIQVLLETLNERVDHLSTLLDKQVRGVNGESRQLTRWAACCCMLL